MLKKIHLVLTVNIVFAVLSFVPGLALAGQILTAGEKSNFTRYSNNQEMMEFLAEVKQNSTEMLLSSYGKSAQGRDLVYAVFSRPMVNNRWEALTSGKPIVMLDAGIHGNERTLRESALMLIRELATEGTKMNDLLDKVVVIMVPCLNPDGTEIARRPNANRSDLNRDFVKLAEPETQAYVSNMLQKWHPHLQIGGHDGGPYPYNLLYLSPTHAAADRDLTKICDNDLFPFIDRNMKAAGYRSFYHDRGNKQRWSAGSPSPNILRNYGGISNFISIVFESPRMQPKKEAIKSGLIAYKAVIEYCANNPQKVISTVESARRKTVEMGQKAKGQIPVQMKYVPEDYKVSYLIPEEIEIQSQNGEDPATKKVLTTVTNADLVKKPVATKTRPRPYAYILPANAHKAIDLLKMHNVTVEILSQDTSLPIEAYVLKNIQHRRRHNHPAANITVEDDTVNKVMDFPKGTYIIRTGQFLGRLISHMLEPETNESLIGWTAFNDLLPKPSPDSLIPVYKLLEPTSLPLTKISGSSD